MSEKKPDCSHAIVRVPEEAGEQLRQGRVRARRHREAPPLPHPRLLRGGVLREDVDLDTLQRGVQWEWGALDGGSII